MKFEKTEAWGFEHAVRGMRNSFNSWDKSDSGYKIDHSLIPGVEKFVIGENDLELAQKLIKAGSEHRKFLRQIMVSVDIIAPLYWWKEFDTYKVGTVANSCSTMHTLTKNPLTIECFETPDFKEYDEMKEGTGELFKQSWTNHIAVLELLRKAYVKTNDKRFWKQIIGLLPEGYLQKRTVTMSYENILAMVKQRKNHKLTQWSVKFVEWVKSLPYAEELIFVPLGEMEKMEDRTMKKEEKWYYPENGEMPERQENGISDHVIVAVEGCTYGMAGYYDFDMKKWFVDGSSEPVNVYAWKDVELPKSSHEVVVG